MKKNSFFLLAFLLSCTAVVAQGVEDMIRFTQTGLHGSARFVGAGGAFGALGNDFSAIHVNPAGASVFRHTEFSMTATIQNNVSQGTYFGTPNYEDIASLSLPSVGYVAIGENKKKDKKTAIAITANRMADFRMFNNIRTGNADFSIVDNWVNAFDGVVKNDLPEVQFQAVNQGLMVEESPGVYSTPLDFDALNTTTTIDSRGRRSEIGLTFSQAIKNKLHWGASLNVVNFTFTETTLHTESGFTNLGRPSLSYSNTVRQDGVGINLRAGVIYKLTNQFRVGISGTTPTIIGINEEYSDRLIGVVESPITVGYYNVITPANITASAAYILGKLGFLSIDYNLTNFGAARFGRTDFDEFGGLRSQNEIVRQQLTNVHTIRAGGEVRLNSMFLRMGYSYVSSPYTDFEDDKVMNVVTGGIGYRTAKFEINGTVATAVSDVEVFPYQPFSPVALQTFTRTSFLVNVAFRID